MFIYENNTLFCEGVAIDKIAEKEKTPLYIYSEKALIENFNSLDNAFADVPHVICYSVKCNSNISILKLLARAGAGFDIVSGGELFRVIQAGGDPGKVVYAGVGKTQDEIVYALKSDIHLFTVESVGELDRINDLANRMGKKARIAIRVNPDVDPKTHTYISTGKKENKFGLDIETAREIYKHASGLPSVKPVGIQMHIGSQITQTQPFKNALDKLIPLIGQLRSDGIELEYVDIGGGLGIVYKDEKPMTAQEFADVVVPMVKPLGLTLIIEPGRFIAGNAGILVTKVEYIKKSGEKTFVIVDAAMNDLMRPALYSAYHNILPVKRQNDRPTKPVDIVGPVCESGDFFAQDRVIALPAQDDLLAVMSAGAYGFTMTSNYNCRVRPPEILVNGTSYSQIRRRETWEDLVRQEVSLKESMS
ncbi:MAG: diaminopimelate decarboxylase [Candidatus Auribacterota bacterium]|jgi:diaminopimelate decarboxylase|nr:diaminopimelate decarboxylase [Candidatus Auribacterota bacterium]